MTHIMTLRRQVLDPPEVGLWALEFADDGYGALASNSGQIKCLEDVLTKQLYRSLYGELFCVEDALGQYQMVSSLTAKMREYSTRNAMLCLQPAGEVALSLHLLTWPRYASRIGWPLAQLYQVFRLKTFAGESSKWVWSCLPRWILKLEALDMPAEHVIKGFNTVTAAEAATSVSAFLPSSSVTTIGLLVLLFHWGLCAPRVGGLREQEARAASSQLFFAFVAASAVGDFAFNILLDDSYKNRWPRPEALGTSISLKVYGSGWVDLTEYKQVMQSGDTSPADRRVLFQWHLDFLLMWRQMQIELLL